jgi:hypothetical protein
MGDDLFSGLAAWMFQKRNQKELQGVKLFEKKWLGVPIGRMLDDVMVDAQKTGKKSVIDLANQLARWHFRIGILTTSLFLGIGLTLMNNYVTKRKVLEEQENQPQLKPKVTPKGLITPASNTITTVQMPSSINPTPSIYPLTLYQNPSLQDWHQQWASYNKNLYGQQPSGGYLAPITLQSPSWPMIQPGILQYSV